MFCPNCSQQQVSDEVRFCSRCGFPLGGVSKLLAVGGVLSENDEASASSKQLSPRRRGKKQGAALMFFGIAILPLLAITAEEVGGIIALTFFIAGLMRLLYALFFQDAAPRATTQNVLPARAAPSKNVLGEIAGRVPELSAARSIPVPNYTPPRGQTAEMPRPPSVTEGTTRLLDE